MKPRNWTVGLKRILPLAALLLGAPGCKPMVEKKFALNGAWAEDGSAALVVESHYWTRTPDQQYWADQGSQDWEIAFLQADPTLVERAELARFPDYLTSSGPPGGIQYSPVYWSRGQGKVLASQYSLPFLFDLQAGTSSELWIPRDVSLTLFGDLPPDVSTRDHPESGFLSFYSTSPDGTRIGVYYSITPNPVLPLGLRVIAFFGMDGRFLAATRLQFSDRLSSPAGAPAFPIYFIWTKDSAGVQVIHVERDPQGLLLPSSRAERIAATDATRSEVTLVPSRTTPTRGGPVSGNGSRFLPLADDLTVDVVPGWIAFEDVPLVPLDDVHYVIDPW